MPRLKRKQETELLKSEYQSELRPLCRYPLKLGPLSHWHLHWHSSLMKGSLCALILFGFRLMMSWLSARMFSVTQSCSSLSESNV